MQTPSKPARPPQAWEETVLRVCDAAFFFRELDCAAASVGELLAYDDGQSLARPDLCPAMRTREGFPSSDADSAAASVFRIAGFGGFSPRRGATLPMVSVQSPQAAPARFLCSGEAAQARF